MSKKNCKPKANESGKRGKKFRKEFISMILVLEVVNQEDEELAKRQ